MIDNSVRWVESDTGSEKMEIYLLPEIQTKSLRYSLVLANLGIRFPSSK